MAILKQIKFGESLNQIAMTKVAIDNQSQSVLRVVETHTDLADGNDPVYTIALAVDGKTILKGDTGLKTSLALQVKAAVDGDNSKKARIAMLDNDGAELSSVNIEDIVGNGVITSTAYNPETGQLTITWAGGSKTVVDLGKLLDIDDVAIESASQKYLNVALNPEAGEKGSQAVFSVNTVKVSEATDEKTGLVDAKDVKDYVDSKATELAVSAQGDEYITASVDGANNKQINVSADVQYLTATAGTVGAYDTEGKETTAPVAATLEGVAQSLVDGADVASKVKTYVDGTVAIEVARADAKVLAAVKALHFTDAAEDGMYVSAVSETDGVISVERLNVADAVLNGYAKGSAPVSGQEAVAATDDVKGAIAKLEHQVDAAKAAVANKNVEAEGDIYVKATASDNKVTVATQIKKLTFTQGSENTDSKLECASGLINGSDAAINVTRFVNARIGEEIAKLDSAVMSTNGTNVEVQVIEDNGKITAVNITADSTANKDVLDAEIAARKAVDGQKDQTYAANSSSNYINNATSLNDADVKLDAALKTADDAMLTGVTGSDAITVSAKTNKNQTISLKLDAATKPAGFTNADNVLSITSEGLYLSSIIDCGTYY